MSYIVPHLNPDPALTDSGANTYIQSSTMPSSILNYTINFGIEFKEIGVELGGDEAPLYWAGTATATDYDALIRLS